jgi:hypothetical protein
MHRKHTELSIFYVTEFITILLEKYVSDCAFKNTILKDDTVGTTAILVAERGKYRKHIQSVSKFKNKDEYIHAVISSTKIPHITDLFSENKEFKKDEMSEWCDPIMSYEYHNHKTVSKYLPCSRVDIWIDVKSYNREKNVIYPSKPPLSQNGLFLNTNELLLFREIGLKDGRKWFTENPDVGK